MRPTRFFALLLWLVEGTFAANGADSLQAFHEDIWKVLNPNAEIKELADGFTWSEGPAWDKTRGRLYFSDVPENKAYVWSPDEGVRLFMAPSGLQGMQVSGFREPGSNGLLMASRNQLLIANHGSRAIELLDIETGLRRPMADRYDDRPFNSPNDIALSSSGTIYFTDPPYGLEGLDQSPLKEQPHNGVYNISESGAVELIDGTLTFPNGIALSPDEQHLFVAVSDPQAAKIYQYKRMDSGYTDRRLFFDAQPYVDRGWQGLPDGMAVAETGHLFASGPGGIFVLSDDGTVLGLIRLTGATANCAFGLDGKTLFITSGKRLLAVETKVFAAGWQHD